MPEHTILDDIYEFVGRFIAYPNDHARVVHTLWIAHTHLIEAFYTTPRLAILSAERRCGKTTLLTITKLLAQNPYSIVAPSPASLYSLIDASQVLPSLLLDEIDRTYERKETADMTTIVDAGFQADQTVPRVSMEPKRHVEQFKVFCPMLLAGIDNGRLPDTVLDRSIVIRLKRRRNEKVEAFRVRPATAEGNALRDKIAAWAKTVIERGKDVQPALPSELGDREKDKWEALFVVAWLADVTDDTSVTAVTANSLGVWETKARQAALAFHAEDKDTEPSSKTELLLRDIKHTFKDHKIKTEGLLNLLHGIEDAPWATYSYGKPLDARGLARLLKPHGIRPKTIRFGPEEAKGYYKADFAEAWERYLPTYPATAVTSVTSVTAVTEKVDKVEGVDSRKVSHGPDDALIAGEGALPSTRSTVSTYPLRT
jgi:Protein of unknown function (DUF3631)